MLKLKGSGRKEYIVTLLALLILDRSFVLYPEPAQQLLRKLTSALGCQLLTRGQRFLAMGPLLRSAGCGQTQEARTARSRNDSPTAGRGFYSGAS